jgi:hypothetical protein
LEPLAGMSELPLTPKRRWSNDGGRGACTIALGRPEDATIGLRLGVCGIEAEYEWGTEEAEEMEDERERVERVERSSARTAWIRRT